MEPLQTWWATELYPMRERDQFGVSGEFEVVLAADAQATIAAHEATILKMGENAAVVAKDAMAAKEQVAALQARVKELEAIKTPDDAFTYCAYCGEKSPVDEHNEDLAAHIKICPKHPMRDVESQLTQRTAELEAAQRERGEAAKDRDDWITSWRALQRHNERIEAELERVRGELAKMRERKDGAYLERNCVVAALATCFPSGVARTAIEGWDEEWHGCVYIDLPVGQVSWHYHDSHAHLFAHLPAYTKPWDGHTTEEKYERVAMLQHRQGMEGSHE